VGDLLARVAHEAEIPVGEDAHRLALARDRHARDAIAGHHLERLEDVLLGAHGDRVDDHARFGALDLVHLGRLIRDREILVDDADAAVLRQADRRFVLRDGVHRRRDQRNAERDLARQLGADLHALRQHLAGPGHQQHVVEGERLGNLGIGHGLPLPGERMCEWRRIASIPPSHSRAVGW
jgi:L-arabinose isomerase